jgi:hypothetical protein
MDKVVVCLPSKYETLNSNPSTTKKKKDKEIHKMNIEKKF